MKSFAVAVTAVLALSAGAASADQAMAQKYACLSCHKVDTKFVGPAYKEVAKKYKGDAKAAEHLVGVIKKGGKGVWGAVPMSPQPQVPDADAKKLADWILSL